MVFAFGAAVFAFGAMVFAFGAMDFAFGAAVFAFGAAGFAFGAGLRLVADGFRAARRQGFYHPLAMPLRRLKVSNLVPAAWRRWIASNCPMRDPQ